MAYAADMYRATSRQQLWLLLGAGFGAWIALSLGMYAMGHRRSSLVAVSGVAFGAFVISAVIAEDGRDRAVWSATAAFAAVAGWLLVISAWIAAIL